MSAVPAITLRPVDRFDYACALERAMQAVPAIEASCSQPCSITADPGQAYLTVDGQSGFYVTATGELRGLFSVVKGRGDALVALAVERGATGLDCFDVGPLRALYERHGFTVRESVPNWTAGGPAVLYMQR